MYAKITEEIQQSYYKQNYPNEGQRFVAWYLRNIHGLDAAQTKLAITDGADDKQIDAIVIDDEAQSHSASGCQLILAKSELLAFIPDDLSDRC